MPSCAISLKATCWDMSVGVAYGGWTYVFLLNTPHLYSILQCVELDLVDSEACSTTLFGGITNHAFVASRIL